MKTNKKHKFKEGDMVKYKNADMWGVQTISGIYQGCYIFENNTPLTISYVDENFELVEGVLFKPKFKMGDKVKGNWGNETFSIKMIDDYGYLLSNNMFVDFSDESTLTLLDDVIKKEHELNTDKEEMVNLCDISDINNLWGNALSGIATEIKFRCKLSMVDLINKTLQYMDCEAFVDDARAGMRLFAKELKKRLGYES